MSGSIALISEREEDFVFAAEVAKQCDSDLILFSEFAKAFDESRKSRFHSVFVAFSDKAAVKMFREQKNPELLPHRVHAIISPKEADVTAAVFESPGIGNFVVNRYSHPLEDGEHYSRVVKAASSEKFGGIGSLIRPTAGIQTVKFTDSLQKGFAANSIAYHLRELQCNERISTTVAGAVDELLMNAMFDAPVDEAGVRLYDRKPRSERLEVTGVEMQIGVEESLIAVSVKDSAGSLSVDKAFKTIAHAFDSRISGSRNVEYQGAGIGLALIVRSGGSIYFATEPGRKTEVTVLFRQTEKFKDFRNPFQFISSRIYP